VKETARSRVIISAGSVPGEAKGLPAASRAAADKSGFGNSPLPSGAWTFCAAKPESAPAELGKSITAKAECAGARWFACVRVIGMITAIKEDAASAITTAR